MAEYQIFTLTNGIRIAHRLVTHTKIVHCGIMLDIGSRDEKPHQTGLAHFWEHMAFKGTQKRKAYHIINSLESVGGELNAYTTKEKVCFYASVLDNHFDRALDILADITFESTFPDKQVEKEKSVILEEMSMYQDSPEDSIQDDFDELIFPNHTLGTNILGTKETVSSFTGTHLREFIQENLDTERIVLSIVGNISFQKAVKLGQKYFEAIPKITNQRTRIEPSVYLPKSVVEEKPINQAHEVIGLPSYSVFDENRYAFFTLIHLLGGSGMNSRFNLSLREKHGLVYGIDASYSPFVDTGLMSIYYATDPKNLSKANSLIWREIEKVKSTALGNIQLKNLKEQIMGQLAISEESNQGYMLMMAKSILDLGRVDTLPEVFKNIDSITSSQLQHLAQETLKRERFCSLIYLPEE